MCTDAFRDDDFIASTIKRVDSYLAGERQAQQADVRAGLDMAGEWDIESMAEYEEWSRMVDAQTQHEDDEYWDRHCATHGSERGPNGLCPECEQELSEERRNDH